MQETLGSCASAAGKPLSALSGLDRAGRPVESDLPLRLEDALCSAHSEKQRTQASFFRVPRVPSGLTASGYSRGCVGVEVALAGLIVATACLKMSRSKPP